MRKVIWNLALIVAFMGIIYSGYQVGSYYLTTHQAQKEYQELLDIAESNPSGLDFTELAHINEDVVGWIRIEGTAIDYPIVQGSDNQEYLNRTFFKTQNPSGAIFMDMRNTSDFTDAHTIIYGHNMKNQTMFEALLDYQEQSFYESHPTFTLYTLEGEFQYEIFSAYVTEATGDAYALTFNEVSEYETYLDYIAQLSLIETHIVPEATDQVITLSTCDNSFGDARMVVQGRLKQ